ncbi:MAG: GrpB family protein [Cyanobacteria bacterium P01_A01_bin.116]
MNTIKVTEYDAAWPQAFIGLKSSIWPAVCDVAIAMEHVGSTSVRGLAAKPILDIDIIIPSSSALHTVIDCLAPLGYKHRGNLGIEGRDAFFAPSELPEHHLYVCLQDGLALQNHLAVRDYLRSHPDKAKAYGTLKKQLAREFPKDIDSYIAGKTEFILNILNETGFARSQMKSIEQLNKLPIT